LIIKRILQFLIFYISFIETVRIRIRIRSKMSRILNTVAKALEQNYTIPFVQTNSVFTKVFYNEYKNWTNN